MKQSQKQALKQKLEIKKLPQLNQLSWEQLDGVSGSFAVATANDKYDLDKDS